MRTDDDVPPKLSVRLLLLRSLLQVAVGGGIWGGVLFGAAGTLSWPRGWIHVGSWIAVVAVNIAVLLRLNPAVLDARMRRQRLTEGYEKFVFVVFLPAFLAIPHVL